MKIPNSEIIMEQWLDSTTHKPHHIVTSTKVRDKYILYEVKNNELVKIKTANNPLKLRNK